MPIPQNVQSGATAQSSHMNQLLNYLRNEISVRYGSTAARPSAPAQGQLYFNTTINGLETWNGSQWVQTNVVVGRPTTPILGQLSWNVSEQLLEVWNGSSWVEAIPFRRPKLATYGPQVTNIGRINAVQSSIAQIDDHIFYARVRNNARMHPLDAMYQLSGLITVNRIPMPTDTEHQYTLRVDVVGGNYRFLMDRHTGSGYNPSVNVQLYRYTA